VMTDANHEYGNLSAASVLVRVGVDLDRCSPPYQSDRRASRRKSMRNLSQVKRRDMHMPASWITFEAGASARVVSDRIGHVNVEDGETI
jgi:hypothetical protein